MTISDLNQVHALKKLIRIETDRLKQLRTKVDVHSPNLNGMPSAPGASDRIGTIVPEIIDQEEELLQDISRLQERLKRLRGYIHSIPDIRIRLIISLRFEDDMTWMEVADRIGGRETEYSVKKSFYRYLQETERKNEL